MSKTNTQAASADVKLQGLRGRDVDLRPFGLDDVTERYRSWLLDEETVKFLDVGFTDRSLPALQAWVEGVIADPRRLFYMLAPRESGEGVGTISLSIDPIHRVCHYGYLIGEREWWGTGIALQAQVALFDFAFDELGMRRVYGGARNDNVMSQFNFKRLGFVKEGVFRQHVRVAPDSDEYCDEIYYGLLAEEWAARSPKFDDLRYHPEND